MKIIKSFGYAFSGLTVAFREQMNIRIHALAAVVICVTGFYLNFNYLEWCIIALACGLVISLELINSAIESVTDLITKEKNPLAGKVKDIAAAAVMISAAAAFAAGAIIVTNHLIK